MQGSYNYEILRELACRDCLKDIHDRKEKVINSDRSMDVRYKALLGGYSDILMNQYINKKRRRILTRWRLSHADLHIESGRYKGTPLNVRTCLYCPNEIEDEFHALFRCETYKEIRHEYNNIVTKYDSVQKILNPKSIKDAEDIGTYIMKIENIRKKFLI